MLNNSEAGEQDCSKRSQPNSCSHSNISKAPKRCSGDFEILDLDEATIIIAARLKQRLKTRQRYADLIIAAQAIAGRHILVTSNTLDFQDLLPSDQLQNWIDERFG